MSHNNKSLSLASNFTLVVHWSARVADFAEEWQKRQALAHTTHPLEFWAEAAGMVLHGVEDGRDQALNVLADLYHNSQQLPAPGDLLFMDALKLKVDQRHFVTHRVGGILQVEVQYYLGVEAYRYASATLPLPTLN